jgi:hypothetical protein
VGGERVALVADETQFVDEEDSPEVDEDAEE